MRTKLIRTVGLLLLAALLLAAPASAETIGGGIVTSYDAHLRTDMDASNNYNILFDLPCGAFVLVEEIQNGWYKVVCNGNEGYVPSSQVRYTYAAEGKYTFDSATSASNVNMRAGASTNMTVVKNIKNAGSELTITGVCGDWLRVTDAEGSSGYIRCDLASYKKGQTTAQASAAQTPASAAPAPTYSAPAVTYSAPAAAVSYSGVGGSIAQTAQLYVGYAYTWGGMSPMTGFDCSGLVNYVCNQHGISLHRVAQDIYTYDGVFVDRDNIQPGDILCFGYGPYSISHVGIYIGNGQMVHASTYTTGVIYSDFDAYYNRMFVGAKRVA